MQVPVLSGESRLGTVMASDFEYPRRKLALPFLFALHNFRSFDGLALPGVREFNDRDFVLRCSGIGHIVTSPHGQFRTAPGSLAGYTECRRRQAICVR